MVVGDGDQIEAVVREERRDARVRAQGDPPTGQRLRARGQWSFHVAEANIAAREERLDPHEGPQPTLLVEEDIADANKRQPRWQPAHRWTPAHRIPSSRAARGSPPRAISGCCATRNRPTQKGAPRPRTAGAP